MAAGAASAQAPSDEAKPEGRSLNGLVLREKGAFDGYTLFAPLTETTTYLIDMDGRVVHTWPSKYKPGDSVYLLKGGTLLRPGRTDDNPTFRAGGTGGIVESIAPDGKVLWAYRVSDADRCQHHDVAPMPDGHVLILAWERKTRREALAAGRRPELLTEGELWTDLVVEVAPDGLTGGKVVWEWRMFDHLVQDADRTKASYGDPARRPERVDVNFARHGRADWTHTNAIDYSPKLDQIVVSPLNLNELLVIDHSTTTAAAAGSTGGASGRGGDILYRWGNPATYRAGTEKDRRLFAQHDVQWIAPGLLGAGRMLIFNNGIGRPDGRYSSVEEIVTPISPTGSYARGEGAAFGPEKAAWSYTAATRREFFSWNISGAQRLPNGNTLICQGAQGRLFEVTAEGQIVWEYYNPFGQRPDFILPGPSEADPAKQEADPDEPATAPAPETTPGREIAPPGRAGFAGARGSDETNPPLPRGAISDRARSGGAIAPAGRRGLRGGPGAPDAYAVFRATRIARDDPRLKWLKVDK